MGALRELDLLTTSCTTLLPVVQAKENECLAILERIGSTSAVNAYRALQLQRIVIVVGMFALFEATLADEFGWRSPIETLKAKFRENDRSKLASRFEEYWLANNVLKHGAGPSLTRLLDIEEGLEFKVKRPGDWFFQEGDLAEGHALILVSDEFILNCSKLIEECSQVASEIEFGGRQEWPGSGAP